VSHAWPVAGNYSVNITAVTCTNSVTKISLVEIHDVVEGVPPQNLAVKPDVDRRAAAPDHSVTTFIQAYSPRQKTCTVDYGDSSSSPDVFAQLTDPIFSVERPHRYPGLGCYAVSLTCENSFGSSSETAVAVGAEPGSRYQNHAKGRDLVIPMAGADGSVGDVVVNVDGTNVTERVRISRTHVTIGQVLLEATGEHRVTFKTAQGLTFLERVVNVETPISSVLLTVDKHATQVNQSVELVVSVMKGDNLFVNLSYGDGNSELFFVESTPFRQTRRYTYSSLGKYTARLKVANALGVGEVLRVVSVERPIRRVSMTVTNVKLLGQPTTFTFNVDPTLTPAMPISVRLDFDDETEETVTLGVMKPVATPLVHTHTYAKSALSSSSLYFEA